MAGPDVRRVASLCTHLLPKWYHFGMSKQIAVRLTEDLVAFVDQIVDSGQQPSRAAVVARALERERRRMIAARDAEILKTAGPDPELAGLAEHVAAFPLAD
jgi:Arc/MetJ-type ribon-helix-helix transcriptional regulator